MNIDIPCGGVTLVQIIQDSGRWINQLKRIRGGGVKIQVQMCPGCPHGCTVSRTRPHQHQLEIQGRGVKVNYGGSYGP